MVTPSATTSTEVPDLRRRRDVLRGGLAGMLRARELGLLIALAVMCTGIAIAEPRFLELENLLTVGRNSSEVGIMALGMTIVLIAAQVDLSVGALYAAGGVFAGLVFKDTGSAPVAIAAALGVGAAVGAMSGALVGFGGLNSFMVTLGVLTIMAGVLQLVTDGNAVSLPFGGPQADATGPFTTLGGKVAGVHAELLVFLALVVIAGIRVPVVTMFAFVISGVLATLAGVLAFSFAGSMGPSGGTGMEFDVFAASVIGGASLAGGRGSMLGTLLGALFLAVARNGFILMGASPFVQTISVGVLIILAIAIDRWVSGRQSR